jgi:hypothetical protein
MERKDWRVHAKVECGRRQAMPACHPFRWTHRHRRQVRRSGRVAAAAASSRGNDPSHRLHFSRTRRPARREADTGCGAPSSVYEQQRRGLEAPVPKPITMSHLVDRVQASLPSHHVNAPAPAARRNLSGLVPLPLQPDHAGDRAVETPTEVTCRVWRVLRPGSAACQGSVPPVGVPGKSCRRPA